MRSVTTMMKIKSQVEKNKTKLNLNFWKGHVSFKVFTQFPQHNGLGLKHVSCSPLNYRSHNDVWKGHLYVAPLFQRPYGHLIEDGTNF